MAPKRHFRGGRIQLVAEIGICTSFLEFERGNANSRTLMLESHKQRRVREFPHLRSFLNQTTIGPDPGRFMSSIRHADARATVLDDLVDAVVLSDRPRLTAPEPKLQVLA